MLPKRRSALFTSIAFTVLSENHDLAKENSKVSLFRPTNNYYFITALGRFASTAAVLLGGVLASHKLFLQLLRNVARSPMVFFEQTPIGNLLNRFSRQMDAIDSVIPDKLKSLLGFLFNLLEIYLVIIVATPRAAMAIVPLTVLYAAFQELREIHRQVRLKQHGHVPAESLLPFLKSRDMQKLVSASRIAAEQE